MKIVKFLSTTEAIVSGTKIASLEINDELFTTKSIEGLTAKDLEEWADCVLADTPIHDSIDDEYELAVVIKHAMNTLEEQKEKQNDQI